MSNEKVFSVIDGVELSSGKLYAGDIFPGLDKRRCCEGVSQIKRCKEWVKS